MKQLLGEALSEHNEMRREEAIDQKWDAQIVEYHVENIGHGIREITAICPECGKPAQFYAGYYRVHPVECKGCDHKYIVKEVSEGVCPV